MKTEYFQAVVNDILKDKKRPYGPASAVVDEWEKKIENAPTGGGVGSNVVLEIGEPYRTAELEQLQNLLSDLSYPTETHELGFSVEQLLGNKAGETRGFNPNSYKPDSLIGERVFQAESFPHEKRIISDRLRAMGASEDGVNNFARLAQGRSSTRRGWSINDLRTGEVLNLKTLLKNRLSNAAVELKLSHKGYEPFKQRVAVAFPLLETEEPMRWEYERRVFDIPDTLNSFGIRRDAGSPDQILFRHDSPNYVMQRVSVRGVFDGELGLVPLTARTEYSCADWVMEFNEKGVVQIGVDGLNSAINKPEFRAHELMFPDAKLTDLLGAFSVSSPELNGNWFTDEHFTHPKRDVVSIPKFGSQD